MHSVKKILTSMIILCSFELHSSNELNTKASNNIKKEEKVEISTISLNVTFPTTRNALKGRVITKTKNYLGIEISPLHPSHSEKLNYRIVHFSEETLFHKEGKLKESTLYKKEILEFQKKMEDINKRSTSNHEKIIYPSPHLVENISSELIYLNDWIVVFSDKNIFSLRNIPAKKILIQNIFEGDIKPPRYGINFIQTRKTP